ncbi:alkaline phosphatase [Geovibrio thiophilus]|uniref:Alkaline phosphatase n=1 Tax=Geovibrio thiophilus TaxID=139438 RepID=A0A3R5XWV8_9BACT|nr:choice-of-anchor I family protein [Geovibrio thiophilus]QAR32616.1 alkaline phosphatase [Geovibrio thiophilus]
MHHILTVLLFSLTIASCSGSSDSKTTTPPAEEEPEEQLAEGFGLTLTRISSYSTGIYDESAAEIATFDPASKRLFFVNANAGLVEIIDFSDPSAPVKIDSIDVAEGDGEVNSIDVYNGVVAAAVQAGNKTGSGRVVFMNVSGEVLNTVRVGSLPDMITFTPDGKYVLTANEGEPNEGYTIDPDGTVSIINISGGIANAAEERVGFTESDIQGSIPVRIKAGTTFAKDAEPEYIAVSKDSKYAYVTLQENNAMAKINIAKGEVEFVKGLGFKDHSVEGNGMDARSRDDNAETATLPVFGMYMPDSVSAYEIDGKTYLVTANEGDSRDDWYPEDEPETSQIRDLPYPLSATAFTADQLTAFADDDWYRRLEVSSVDGIENGEYTKLYTYGARSFSIWDENLEQVFDSGDDFETRLIALAAEDGTTVFNASSTNNSLDSRSNKKGPEPEGAEIAVIGGKTIAFIGLERAGGIMAYEVTNPTAPRHLTYVQNRNYIATGDIDEDNFEAEGDLAPEGLIYISKKDSPSGKALLVVCNETSGTVTTYEINAE